MQLKTRPIAIALIVILALTILTFMLVSSVRYTSTSAVQNYIKSHADDIAIACANPNNPQSGYYLNAEQPYPLAGTGKLLILIAYAEAVSAGKLDPHQSVKIADLEKFYLPGTDGGAHPEFLKSLPASQTVASLDQIAGSMVSLGSNASSDYLLSRLNQSDFDVVFSRLNLTQTERPYSFLGLYLFINNHETGLYAEEPLSTDEFLAEQSRLSNLFITDKTWRDAEINFITKPANAAPLAVQKQVINLFATKSSANNLQTMLFSAYGYNNNLTSRAQSIIQTHLEWPLRINPDNTQKFSTLASISGAWPGILTSAWYGQANAADPRTLVTLYRNVPDDFWNTWITSFSHQQFESQVLSTADCSLFPQIK